MTSLEKMIFQLHHCRPLTHEQLGRAILELAERLDRIEAGSQGPNLVPAPSTWPDQNSDQWQAVDKEKLMEIAASRILPWPESKMRLMGNPSFIFHDHGRLGLMNVSFPIYFGTPNDREVLDMAEGDWATPFTYGGILQDHEPLTKERLEGLRDKWQAAWEDVAKWEGGDNAPIYDTLNKTLVFETAESGEYKESPRSLRSMPIRNVVMDQADALPVGYESFPKLVGIADGLQRGFRSLMADITAGKKFDGTGVHLHRSHYPFEIPEVYKIFMTQAGLTIKTYSRYGKRVTSVYEQRDPEARKYPYKRSTNPNTFYKELHYGHYTDQIAKGKFKPKLICGGQGMPKDLLDELDMHGLDFRFIRWVQVGEMKHSMYEITLNEVVKNGGDKYVDGKIQIDFEAFGMP